MKAAVFESLNNITVRDIPTPEPKEGEALVRVRSCAVCGSDIRIFHTGNARVTPPRILGHEIAGEVVSVGRNVRSVAPGDRVAVGADVPCGSCLYCKAGMGNNCPVNHAMGYQYDGGFAEYVLLNETVMHFGPVCPLPAHVPYDEGALAEPLGCVLNAMSLAPVRLNDTVAVIGAGPLGMMICDAARLSGAAKVMLVNRSAQRLVMAERIGAADVYIRSSEEDAVARVLGETGGLGADVIYTACPSPQAQADAIQMARNRAHVSFFGGLPKGGSLVPLDTNIIHYKELTVTGAHGATPAHHAQAVELISSGRMDVKKYVTHRFTLDDIESAFAAAEGHTGLRAVVNP